MTSTTTSSSPDDTWANHHPLASGQARRWGPPPANPTDDAPWMRALVALVRAEL